MPEAVLLLLALAVAGTVVLAPLRERSAGNVGEALPDDERHAALVRHRVALEALRDVEADRRAGSLDDAGYAAQLAEAEAHAAETRAALALEPQASTGARVDRRGRTIATVVAGMLGIALLGGALVPGTGIGNATVTNQPLADAQRAESARQERIAKLLDALAEEPRDAATLSALADEYLSGPDGEDLARAGAALQLLIQVEPDRADAYERIMTAYLRAGDTANARAAHTAYADLESGSEIEAAFFDGLIARREDDGARAVEAFERFLELAPDDERAGMVRALRDEAASD